MLVTQSRVRDRNPDIPAAGKQWSRGPGSKECLLQQQDRPSTPEEVKRFRSFNRPDVGMPRVFPVASKDPSVAKDLCHGVTSKESLAVKDLVNPPRATAFQALKEQQKESLYSSNKMSPLGKSHDHTLNLPENLDLDKATFGKTTIKEDSAGSMVNPAKTQDEVMAEDQLGRDLYKRSHNSLEVGEMVDRNYDWSKFTRDMMYGVPTPHDNTGIEVRKAMHWIGDPQNMHKAQIVPKVVDDFRERTQPQLGKVHDSMAETLLVPKSHTFGVAIKPDDFGAGQLLHSEAPSVYLQCWRFDKGVLSSIRNKLKKEKFTGFEALLNGLKYLDKDGSGTLAPDLIRKQFFHYDVPLTPDMLELLIHWCTLNGQQQVGYADLIALVNWKEELSADLRARVEQYATPPGGSQDQIPRPPPPILTNYLPTSQKIQATADSAPSHNLRVFGVPTIRSDIPAPRIKRVADTTNYGDEPGAYSLLYPSLYSNMGLYGEDFFAYRSQEEIRGLFEKIGVAMAPEVFQKLWEIAASRDPNNRVSVESFRAIMEEIQAQRIAEMADTER